MAAEKPAAEAAKAGGRRDGLPPPAYDEPGNRVFQERNAKLGDPAGRVGDRFTYTYDFGDSERPTVKSLDGFDFDSRFTALRNRLIANLTAGSDNPGRGLSGLRV